MNICLDCGKAIVGNNKYCNQMCLRRHRLLGNRIWKSPMHLSDGTYRKRRLRPGLTHVCCNNCGKVITKPRNVSWTVYRDRKFCNVPCFQEYYKSLVIVNEDKKETVQVSQRTSRGA